MKIYQLREELTELNAQIYGGENKLRNNQNKMEA